MILDNSGKGYDIFVDMSMPDYTYCIECLERIRNYEDKCIQHLSVKHRIRDGGYLHNIARYGFETFSKWKIKDLETFNTTRF